MWRKFIHCFQAIQFMFKAPLVEYTIRSSSPSKMHNFHYYFPHHLYLKVFQTEKGRSIQVKQAKITIVVFVKRFKLFSFFKNQILMLKIIVTIQEI
ncbi:unnamed protein product [Paramecium sonneborni]|uniref:Uncharacterized protein n=1 Tax=Paramecium sonneborni TaxID=65129 RepID=A0A8S1NR12_9CILI|nr:unnamed protein product [Paramecium sonneborni]